MATIPAVTESRLIVTRVAIEWDEAGGVRFLQYEAHTDDANGATVRRTSSSIAGAELEPGAHGVLAAVGRLIEARLAAWADL